MSDKAVTEKAKYLEFRVLFRFKRKNFERTNTISNFRLWKKALKDTCRSTIVNICYFFFNLKLDNIILLKMLWLFL
jgi:hypothetical protein